VRLDGVVLLHACSLAVDPILHYGSDAQKEKYLPKLARGEWIGCFALSERRQQRRRGNANVGAPRRRHVILMAQRLPSPWIALQPRRRVRAN